MQKAPTRRNAQRIPANTSSPTTAMNITSKSHQRIKAAQAFLVLLAAACLSIPVGAQPNVLAGESGIFCSRGGEEAVGVMCDLAKEMQRRLNYSPSISIVPLSRLKITMKQKGTNTLYLPALEGEEHAKNLQIVVEMVRDEYVVVTSTRANAVKASMPEARQLLRVGVLRGSHAQIEAERLGWTNIDVSGSQEACAKKLNMGRTDGWISTWNGARYSAKSAGIDIATLLRGAHFLDAKLALMASSDISGMEIERWRRAFRAMKADGTVARIYKKYDFQPVSGDK